MAQRFVLVDDLDGETEGAETIDFAYRGRTYEIDLAEANGKRLDEALAPFIEAARVRPGTAPGAGRLRRRPGQAAAPRTGSAKVRRTAELADVRAWAKQAGRKVNDRGRVPEQILRDYDAAHPGR